MPEQEGMWRYEICLPGGSLSGTFDCGKAREGCHGKVTAVEDGFRYADGSKFLPFGTTCYAWIYQPAGRQEQTLATLRNSCFNKVRMFVFPKHMPYNNEEPERFPFLRDENGQWDMSRLDYVFWNNLDRRIAQLEEAGIEADLILFHPYDKWGFEKLSRTESLQYLEYCVARFAAYHNLWWSLANEYEMLVRKEEEDWDAFGMFLKERDIYRHLISIHNIMQIYPRREWMTHCSIQSGDLNRIPYWKKKYGMPVLIDECGYEGDLEFNWGNLSAFDMVDCFWWSVTRGGYCTHGETFHSEDEVLWWSKGGVLHGESEPRIRFLKDLLYSLPGTGKAEELFEPWNPNEERKEKAAIDEKGLRYLELVRNAPEENKFGLYGDRVRKLEADTWKLFYFGHRCPCRLHVNIPGEEGYDAELIDVWEMKRTVLEREVTGERVLKLPAKPGMAVLLTRLNR